MTDSNHVKRFGETIAKFEFSYQASAFARFASRANPDMPYELWENGRLTETWEAGNGVDPYGRKCRKYNF